MLDLGALTLFDLHNPKRDGGYVSKAMMRLTEPVDATLSRREISGGRRRCTSLHRLRVQRWIAPSELSAVCPEPSGICREMQGGAAVRTRPQPEGVPQAPPRVSNHAPRRCTCGDSRNETSPSEEGF